MARKKTKITKPNVASGPISAKELKFWLAGFLDMQDEGWCPNAEQWEKIKDKIFNLEDTAPAATHTAPAVPKQFQRAVAPPPSAFEDVNVFNEGGGAGLDAAPTFPVARSSFEDLEMDERARARQAAAEAAAWAAANGGQSFGGGGGGVPRMPVVGPDGFLKMP